MIGWMMDRIIPEKRRDQLETSLIEGMLLVIVSVRLADRAEHAKRVLEANHATQLAVLPASDSAPAF